MAEQKAQSIQKKHYLETVALFSKLGDEKTQSYLTLILTFASLIFFGLFAINPTLSTIAKLQREVEDVRMLDKQFDQKINNLSTLQQLYASLQPDIEILLSAIPSQPEAPRFLAQIQTLASENSVKITALKTGTVALRATTVEESTLSLPFEVIGQGSEEQLRNFYSAVASMTRITTFDSISLGFSDDENVYTLSMKGKAYFKQ